MLLGFHPRLVATVIGLVAVTAALVGVTAYVLVGRSLRSQLIDSAVAQADFNIGVLASEEVLPSGADISAFAASGLADRFSLRGTTGVYVDFGVGEEAFASSFAYVNTPELVSPRLQNLVASGELGYQFLEVAGDPALVVAGRRPPTGPDFYFIFPAAEVENALGRLRVVLLGTGIAVSLLGALAAGAIARRVLHPVRLAADAAARMASGDLTARVPGGADDEFGLWAQDFNRMAATLEQKVAELEAARAREQRFVADVSHELRTPLTALVNEAAMLGEHLEAMPETEARLGALLVADVDRLRRLVDDLLEVSRLEAGVDDETLQGIDLQAFFTALINSRHPEAQLTLPADLGRVMTDPRSLERIVGNVLDNARLHAPGAPVHVTVALEGEALVVSIRDEGPGVPAEAMAHIFDRFYKVDTARRGGTGLGLSIAFQHARRLGGDLTVRPGEPTGLQFELRLPVTDLLLAGDGDATTTSHPGVMDSEPRREP